MDWTKDSASSVSLGCRYTGKGGGHLPQNVRGLKRQVTKRLNPVPGDNQLIVVPGKVIFLQKKRRRKEKPP
jgi:hypothetical protein